MRQRLRGVKARYNFHLQGIMTHLGGSMGYWSETTITLLPSGTDVRARREYGHA
jgi:hypothetical protein